MPIEKIENQDGYIGYSFKCPGCEDWHEIRTQHGKSNLKGPCWTFNGNERSPTFTPSLMVKSGHYCHGQEGKDCWCTFKERFGEDPFVTCYVCHSFITNGNIEFLSDCTHKLVGQTVPL